MNNFFDKIICIFKSKKNLTLGILVLGLTVFFLTGYKNQDYIVDREEKRLAYILSKIENVGQVEVMITYDEELSKDVGNFNLYENKTNNTKDKKIKGVIVVASGSKDLSVKYTIENAVQTALNIPAQNINVFIMGE